MTKGKDSGVAARQRGKSESVLAIRIVKKKVVATFFLVSGNYVDDIGWRCVGIGGLLHDSRLRDGMPSQ